MTPAAPPRTSALLTADDSQQQLDIGVHAQPAAWMWAPVTDKEQGEWRRGYTTWDAAFEAVGAWLHAEARAISGGGS